MTVPRFQAEAAAGRKLSMVTAYDALFAAVFDAAGVDSILVGDSLGMVVQGKQGTIPVTLEQMIYHGEIVARTVQRALVVVDLPFMSYQLSARQALRSAGRIIKETGAAAVKLEGGRSQEKAIHAIRKAGIPVMGHIGMQPQSVHDYGSMGKIQKDEERLLEDALAAESAGAFAIVIELVPRAVAQRITEELSIPTIGIGAGPACDGQVLVGPDLLGLTHGFEPKFLKRYADLYETAKSAAEMFVDDVRSGTFPADEHSH